LPRGATALSASFVSLFAQIADFHMPSASLTRRQARTGSLCCPVSAFFFLLGFSLLSPCARRRGLIPSPRSSTASLASFRKVSSKISRPAGSRFTPARRTTREPLWFAPTSFPVPIGLYRLHLTLLVDPLLPVVNLPPPLRSSNQSRPVSTYSDSACHCSFPLHEMLCAEATLISRRRL
jgi:hypothetical protein